MELTGKFTVLSAFNLCPANNQKPERNKLNLGKVLIK